MQSTSQSAVSDVRPRVVLVSTMYSPFQTELGRAINAQGLVDYHILYTMTESRGRGSHWTEDAARVPAWVHVARPLRGQAEFNAWVAEKLDELRPHVIVTSAMLSAPTWKAMTALKDTLHWHGFRTPIGYWLEHPDMSRPAPTRVAVETLTRLQIAGMDFVFAIGDRAEAYYRRCHPTLPIHIVPYGADLGPCFAIERSAVRHPDSPVTFLFSGQLVARNNIAALTDAFALLAESHPGRFAFIVSASGPEERHLTALSSRSAVFASALRYDRVFQTWNDRLRPFRDADVLVCPSLHAGWALVVPEAMAAAMPVIATRAVSAARYFVRPEVSGLLIRPDAADIHRALVRFVEEPHVLKRMGEEARHAAHAGTAEFIGDLYARAALREWVRARGY